MVDDLPPTETSWTKSDRRQSRSCDVCRLRKVKCDRIQPCHACCAHGYPSKCVYNSAPDDDLRPISQAEAIRKLRGEIRELRSQIGQGQVIHPHLRRLEHLLQNIRTAPLNVVHRIIADIRSHAVASVGPWEGTEVYDDLSEHSSPTHSQRPRLEAQKDGTSGSVGDFNTLVKTSELSDDDDFSLVPSVSSYKPAVDVYVQRFVDAFSPEVDAKSGHAGALRAAASIRMFSPILTDAFEAVSVAFFGRTIQDRSIESNGFGLYRRVVRVLNQALSDPERSKAESTLMTVILLIAYESVERTSQRGVAVHVRGATQLIEHRGPENHIHGVEHLTFAEMRPYWVASAFVSRTPSFLAREDWKTIPWSAETTTKDLLDHLLDLSVEIPAILCQSDKLIAAQRMSAWSEHEVAMKQQALWGEITELTKRFRQWKRDWVDCYPDGTPQEVPADSSDGAFPTFHCRNLATGEIKTPTKITYPDLRVAQTMCVYYAKRLILSSVDTRPDRVGPKEQYDLACGICRSLEWYILTAPGNMINRLAFSVRVAWEALPAEGPERAFIQAVFVLVEKRHSLGLWGSAMPELSPRRR